jgi:prephenate dehydrogenase
MIGIVRTVYITSWQDSLMGMKNVTLVANGAVNLNQGRTLMNKRQKKKAFKKMYGINPNKVHTLVSSIASIDWKMVGEMAYEGMIQTIKHISNCYASLDHVLEMLKVRDGDIIENPKKTTNEKTKE